jgi:hypothetical protein
MQRRTHEMLATDPLTKTNIFRSPTVTRQLIANFVLVAFAATLVVLRFVARRIRKTKIWYVDLVDDYEFSKTLVLIVQRWDDAAAVASLIFTSGTCHYSIKD